MNQKKAIEDNYKQKAGEMLLNGEFDIVQRRRDEFNGINRELEEMEKKLGFDGHREGEHTVKAFCGTTAYNAFQEPTLRELKY